MFTYFFYRFLDLLWLQEESYKKGPVDPNVFLSGRFRDIGLVVLNFRIVLEIHMKS